MLIVKKFGGTSVGDKERMYNVANRCIEEYKKGNDVVVVLSAMGKYTDELIRLVFELCYTASGKWVKPVTQEGRATLEEFHEQMAQRRKKKQTA